MVHAATIVLALAAAPPAPPTADGIHLHRLGTHAAGALGRSASEIAAFHAPSKRLWVVNGAAGIDVLDISDPSAPRKVATHAMPPPTSVAIQGDLVAVALPSGTAAPGTVRFLDLDGRTISEVTVGHGPDMCTFTPDGTALVVADEGEPVGDADPEGSVSIVDLRNGPAKATVRTAGFRAFEAERARLASEGAHLPVPGATVAQQSEPEYVAISPDGRQALVTLQESNALARIDLEDARVLSMTGLGLKDFRTSGLDASDADGGIDIRPWPVFGLRQPDTVVTWESGGVTWAATSDEGEARETEAFDEMARVKELDLDVGAFPATAGDPRSARDAIAKPENLGQLQVSRPACDPDGDGKSERLVAFGGRGITVWRLVDGIPTIAWDSGDQVERTVAERMPEAHNGDGKKPGSKDARSTSRGPEVEGLTLGAVGGRRLLFAGLERSGGVMTWDVTDPTAPVLLDYVNARDPAAELGRAGDVAPEGLVFIPAEKGPTGRPLLVVCNEVSGTTTIWEVREGRADQPPKEAPAAAAPVAARTIALKAVPGAMKYDVTEVRAAPGEVLEFVLENPDSLPHNLLITAPGKMPEVGVACDKMGETLEGKARQFVPELPSVLASMGLVDPGRTGRLRWVVPQKPGTYPFVCTYPGHWRTMNGKIKVTAPAPR